jgi:hypothetical protein
MISHHPSWFLQLASLGMGCPYINQQAMRSYHSIEKWKLYALFVYLTQGALVVLHHDPVGTL